MLDTLKAVSEDERDCIAVLERVSRLAEDSGKPQFDPLSNFCFSAFEMSSSVVGFFFFLKTMHSFL